VTRERSARQERVAASGIASCDRVSSRNVHARLPRSSRTTRIFATEGGTMHIELVVFDMVGTTVRDDRAVARCFREVLREANVTPSDAEVNAVMGLAKPTAIEILLRRHDVAFSPADIDLMHEMFVAKMCEHYRHDPNVCETLGMSRAFRQLHQMGTQVALDTGFDRAITDAILTRLGWSARGLVDASVTSDEVARGRPYPDMIWEAMHRTGVRDPARVAKVGDTPTDLQEGAAAGCTLVIGVTSGGHDAVALRAHPCTHVVPSASFVPEIVRHAEAADAAMR
jgi:phosphonatase-like hydrolase